MLWWYRLRVVLLWLLLVIVTLALAVSSARATGDVRSGIAIFVAAWVSIAIQQWSRHWK